MLGFTVKLLECRVYGLGFLELTKFMGMQSPDNCLPWF